MKHFRKTHRRNGYLLMEVVIAMAIFSLVAVGFTKALNKAADASDLAAKSVQITRILHSAMDEALSVPMLQEEEIITELEERNLTITTRYEPMIEELQNRDEQYLQDMWRITVIGTYLEAGNKIERSVVTWRYGKLYQP
jgi:type II secretory pathway pseudopilin PulG